MYTFQDFEEAKGTETLDKFIITAIGEFKNSDEYNIALKAQKYYEGENVEILDRLMWFYNSMGLKEIDRLKANNRIVSEFFHKIVSQENSYLLGNGATIDDKVKAELGGNKFDIKLQMSGLMSLVHGVSWGYCHIDNGKFRIKKFNATEFIPLFDEYTSELKAGIRFIYISEKKGTIIELYELDGKAEYLLKGGKLAITKPKTSYRIIKAVDKIEERIIESKNWSKLPVVPLYANELKRSSLTVGLKSKIDVYDFVASDLANNLEENKDIIYLLKNYQGEGLDKGIGQFLADLKYYGVVNVDETGDIDTKQIDIPHEARKLALNELKSNIYSDAMALDLESIRGGSLTNVAIKASMVDLDLKTDKFEWQVVEYLENILSLYDEFKGQAYKDYDIKFIRRNIVNDTELVENIYKFREDISRRTALELNPYIEDVEEELLKIEEEARATVTINNTPIKKAGEE